MLKVVKKLFLLLSPRERRRFYARRADGDCQRPRSRWWAWPRSCPSSRCWPIPARIESNGLLHLAYTELGFSSPETFLVFLGFAVLGLILFSLCVRLVAIFAISRFSNMRAYSLSRQLIENYLRQPYPWFLHRNSAELSKTVLIEVQRVVNQAIMPAMLTISQFALVLSLFGFLLAMEPVIALLAVIAVRRELRSGVHRRAAHAGADRRDHPAGQLRALQGGRTR